MLGAMFVVTNTQADIQEDPSKRKKPIFPFCGSCFMNPGEADLATVQIVTQIHL